MRKTIVLDTNTILSAALFPNSIVRKAFEKATIHFQIVASDSTWKELNTVFHRPKFDRYLFEVDRINFLNNLFPKLNFTEPTETITDCRDPKDNKFLELAVAANAVYIITGDEDLLVLNPYRHISILKSGAFLELELNTEG